MKALTKPALIPIRKPLKKQKKKARKSNSIRSPTHPLSRGGALGEKTMATYNDETKVIALVLMLICLIVGGYMDDQDAQLMDRASVQVAQK